jgi:hypothetical protein
LIPQGRPGSAIAAGYLGLLSLFPFIGFPFAIAAIVTGVIALKTLKKDASLIGRGRAWFGLITGCFALIVNALLLTVVVLDLSVKR